ncbi:conserved hypothetical protein [Candidatus Zixiibacteriota bacterium]|nr:conserved hypothetical protein [candidate division Zixibacteria bacterium]
MAISYSFSRIGTFFNCPRQYKFEHIEKAAVEKPVGVEAFLGDAVHRTLERLYRLKMDGKTLTQSEALEYYLKYWEGPDRDKIKVTREELGIDDYIEIGSRALAKYFEMLAPFDDGISVALERMFRFPLDPAGRFSIQGKIDRVCRRADGVVEIIDYKTGAALPTQQSLDDSDQMGLYQIGVNHLWPDFKEIELKQIFLRHGVILKATMDADKLEEVRYRTFQRILEIERARREDNFPPKESSLCNWCVYFQLCPAKRHKLALDDEISVEFDAEFGRDLASKYLQLTQQKKVLETELKALKEDITKYAEETEVTALTAPEGNVKISFSEADGFPSKTEDEETYLKLSLLAREANLEECFKLDQNVLYKEFFAKERLPQEVQEQLKEFLRRKREIRLTTRFEEE